MSARFIPDQILAEILKRLPVESLLRFRRVRKSWNSLIKTPYFINLHSNYNHNIHANTPKFLLFCSLDSLSLSLRYDDRQCKEFKQIKFHPCLDFCDWHAISSGLICLSGSRTSNIYLWNPVVNRYKTLPVHNLPPLISSTDVKWASLSFGFVHSMNDYRVVRIVNYYATNRTDRSFVVCVYSLNTNSWKTKTIRDDFLVEILQPRSNTVNGVSFWLVNKENVKTLLSYDTNNDVLRNTALPDHQMGAVFSMHQYGQSLAYFAGVDSNVINMWILKEDSKNKYFWEKKFSVNLDKDIGTGVLGIRNNGELILSRLTDLVSYDAEQKKVNDFVESWNCWPCNAKHMVLAPGFPSCWCTNAVNNAGYLGTPPFVAEQFVGSLVLLDVEWKNSSRL